MRAAPGASRDSAALLISVTPAIVLIGSMVVAGCTGFDPMRQGVGDRRFPSVSPAGPAASGAAYGCRQGSRGAECEVAPNYIDDFHAGMGRVMWEIDMERRALNQDALERTRLSSAFNMLTWPAVAWVGTKQLRDPGWSPRDALALGFAAYRMLGEGVPERDRIYLQTANRLACSLVVAEAYLYRKPVSADLGVPVMALDELYESLQDARKAHEIGRGMLVKSLKVESKPAPKPRDEVHRMRLEAIGKVGADAAPNPVRPMLKAFSDTHAAAGKALVSASDLQSILLAYPAALGHQGRAIESAKNAELIGRAPEAADPIERARQVAQIVKQALAASVPASTASGAAGKAHSGRGAVDAEDWEPTPDRLRGLADTAVDGVNRFWIGNELPLRQKTDEVQRWLARHQARVDRARGEARALGCGSEDLAVFAAALAVRAAQSAASAASQNGSESALPAAGAGKP